MRASAAAERAGIPTASIVLTGFLKMARAIAQSQGMTTLPLAEYPGVIMTDSREDVRQKTGATVVNNIIEALTRPVETAVRPVEPGPRDIVFKGNLDEVNDFFTEKLWSDGLPIIPPTLERVERFLEFTDRSPGEPLGILLPEKRESTVWNIAVNGVMAGCRPEYMPVLIAAVESIAEPDFRIEDGGSTPGWEPLVILNGPIIKELDFNYEAGVMRIGRRANASVGRFLRLYLRNVAGLRIPPGSTDKGTIALNFNVVLAENEDAVAQFGWEPFSVDRGFKRGENVVTVQSVVYTSSPTYSAGASVLAHLETIAEVIGRHAVAPWTHMGVNRGRFYPLIVMSPSVAGVIARSGWTKYKVRQYLYDNVKAPAGWMENLSRQNSGPGPSFYELAKQGIAPAVYGESNDPDRLVPVFLRPEWTGIVVSGDPSRNQSKAYIQNHRQGPPTSKKVILPANWTQLLNRTKSKSRLE